MKVGDDIEITYERKGNYDRITSINGAGGNNYPAPSGAGVPSSGGQAASVTPKPESFPISMKVSYAKDLLAGGTVGTPKEAVAIINELESEFKKAAVEGPLVSTGTK